MPWRDAPTIGNLLGTRMALNEFVAYSQLGPLKATLDPQVVHDRDVRAVRVRQLQLDRHPDRRHRRAGADPPSRSGAARPARDAGRHASPTSSPPPSPGFLLVTARACDYFDQVDRAADAMSVRRHRRPFPDVAVVLGSGLGDFAEHARRRGRRCRTRTAPLAGVEGDRTRRPAGRSARWPAKRVAALAGRAHFYEGHDLRTVTFGDARAGAARGQDADPDQRRRRHQYRASRRAR